ncbi:MAG: YdcH family protein [Thiohalophilus sp.]|uniref:YdcH family protein n=1 Tax=Thiohalophilus sp. TaxID=3028392 RepID=UPI00287079C3|nr:YdcH family protein [Thiohalophilus sp.]MDR9436347.1 YdcH family protein [Thiohalophilus sp.]
MDEHESAQLRDKLQTLVSEHRDLDDVINRLAQDPTIDQLQLTRMKKRKLQLKDMIARVRSRLIPDMEA